MDAEDLCRLQDKYLVFIKDHRRTGLTNTDDELLDLERCVREPGLKPRHEDDKVFQLYKKFRAIVL